MNPATVHRNPITADCFCDNLIRVCDTADTRSLDWFQEGDIGMRRKAILENLPKFDSVKIEDFFVGRTRGVQFSEKRAGKEPDAAVMTYGILQRAASLRAFVVCALVRAWSAVEGETTCPIPCRLVKCDSAFSVGDLSSGNLLVQGDNLPALNALLLYDIGQLKCIYIDSHYSTRNMAMLRGSLMQGLYHDSMSCQDSRTMEAKESCDSSYPVADFFKPVEYNWRLTDFEADQALKIFNEHTNADC